MSDYLSPMATRIPDLLSLVMLTAAGLLVCGCIGYPLLLTVRAQIFRHRGKRFMEAYERLPISNRRKGF